MTEDAPGGALLRALAELAERAGEDKTGAVELERRLCALEAGLAAEAREREGVWAGSQRLCGEVDGRLREFVATRLREALETREGAAVAMRQRAAERWWRSAIWAVERIGLPLASAAAGALAAQRGWLP